MMTRCLIQTHFEETVFKLKLSSEMVYTQKTKQLLLLFLVVLLSSLNTASDGLLESSLNIKSPRVTLDVQDFAKDSVCTQEAHWALQ